MPISPEIAALVNQLNQEFDKTETDATEGASLVRALLSRFPDNVRLIQFFSFFSNALLFVEISRRRVQALIERVCTPDVTAEEVQEAGEDLGILLERVLEAKMSGRQILDILKQLQ